MKHTIANYVYIKGFGEIPYFENEQFQILKGFQIKKISQIAYEIRQREKDPVVHIQRINHEDLAQPYTILSQDRIEVHPIGVHCSVCLYEEIRSWRQYYNLYRIYLCRYIWESREVLEWITEGRKPEVLPIYKKIHRRLLESQKKGKLPSTPFLGVSTLLQEKL